MRIKEELALEGYEFKGYSGRFGLEIETETRYADSYPNGFFRDKGDGKTVELNHCNGGSDYWTGHYDNSLRNFGMEFVLNQPYDLKNVKKALSEFSKMTENVKFLKDAPATSVHVHINILPETFLTLGNFLTLYCLYENVLIEFSGENRRSNLFALPIRVAENTYKNIEHLFTRLELGDRNSINFSPEHVKYASLNLACLTTLGSLEVRCFRGTTDTEEIYQWVSVLDSMMNYSKTLALTPPVILSTYRDRPDEFFSEVFGDMAPVLRRVVGDVDQVVNRNLWYAFRVADAVTNWNEISDVFSKKWANKKAKKKYKEFKLPEPILTPTQMQEFVSLTATPGSLSWESALELVNNPPPSQFIPITNQPIPLADNHWTVIDEIEEEGGDF